MRKLTHYAIFRVFLPLVLALFLPGAVNADNYNLKPRLFAVTVPGLTTEPREFDIPIQYGEGKSSPIAQSDTWRIHGGTVFDQQPSSRRPILVELHGKVGPVRKLVAKVMVQYQQNTEGKWQPLYQFDQEPLMVKTPQGWQPLFDSRESPEILGVINRDFPNAAGYRSYIDFKIQRGKIIIDSWNVKTTY